MFSGSPIVNAHLVLIVVMVMPLSIGIRSVKHICGGILGQLYVNVFVVASG